MHLAETNERFNDLKALLFYMFHQFLLDLETHMINVIFLKPATIFL